MSCSVTDCFIFLFIYTCNGSPLGDRPMSREAEPTQFIPAQWGKDSQIAYQWPQGEVPYYFDTKSYDDGIKTRVLAAMSSLERDSCIRFKEQYQVPANNSGPWIHFTNPAAVRHCFHDCSYQANGEVKVVLGYDCLKQQDITHALLHGIGFRDEVAHPQRDLYIKVMWSNIQPAYRSMFRLQPVDSLAVVEYDPQSIMHFHERAFSLNGQATITPLLPGLKIQPSEDLSHLDKMKLRIMFGHECNKRKVHEVLDTCQDILSEVNKDVTITENKNEVPNVIKEDKGSEKNLILGDVPSVELGNKNNNNPSEDTTVVGENNENVGGNEKGKSPSEEVIVVGDDVGKGSGSRNSKSSSEEMIVMGDDVGKGSGNDHKGKPSEETIVDNDDVGIGSGNDHNQKPSEEMIVVGDDVGKGSGNDHNEKPSEEMIVDNDDVGNGSGNDHKEKPSEEMIIVGDDVGKGSGNDHNEKPSEEMIVVGDDVGKGSDNDHKDKPSEEMIIVGDDVGKGSGNDHNEKPSEEMIVDNDDVGNGSGNEHNQKPSEEMIVVGDDVGKGSGNDHNEKPSEEMIVVGDDVGKGSDNDHKEKPSEEMIIVGDDVGKGKGNVNSKNPFKKMIVVGDNIAKDGGNENNNNPSQGMIVVGDGNTNKNNNDYHGSGNFNGGAFLPLKAGPEKSKLVVVGKGDNNLNSIRNDNNRNTIDGKKELFIFGDRSTKSSGAVKGIAKSAKDDDISNVVSNHLNDSK